MVLRPHGAFVVVGALLCLVLIRGAPAQTTPDATASPPTAPSVPSTPWSLGPIDFSGFLDVYYSNNANHPSSTANGQVNDLYNFNDKTDQFNLSAAELTIRHDPDPVGLRVDLIFGRTSVLIHGGPGGTNDRLEQAFISLKPRGMRGAEFDFGQFVTSAGAEVIAAKDNWNYSRSLLFAWAIPYYHFGLRTSFPATKAWNVGLQVVNGWNEIAVNNGGATIGLTSAWVKPAYTWSLNFYSGPQAQEAQRGYRNLIDTTLLLTPNSKLNAYINYDYGQNRTASHIAGDTIIPSESPHWQGIAVAARRQIFRRSALAGRYEYYVDNQGFETGAAQTLQEYTGTYEYTWRAGLLTRVEYRRDWSDIDFFHKGDSGHVKAQSTATIALIAVFGKP